MTLSFFDVKKLDQLERKRAHLGTVCHDELGALKHLFYGFLIIIISREEELDTTRVHQCEGNAFNLGQSDTRFFDCLRSSAAFTAVTKASDRLIIFLFGKLLKLETFRLKHLTDFCFLKLMTLRSGH